MSVFNHVIEQVAEKLIKPGAEKLIKALDGELELADQSRLYGGRSSWGRMEEDQLQQEDGRDNLMKDALVSVEPVTRSRTKDQREKHFYTLFLA